MNFSTLFDDAKKSLKGKTILVAIIVLIYSIVVNGFTIVDDIFTIRNAANGVLDSSFNSTPLWVLAATFVFQALLIVGYTNTMLNVAKGKNVKLGDLVSNWRLGFKAMCLVTLELIYVLLWSMLFIIPGIIKFYSYSMSLYILVEDPSKGINQCITESRELMDGYKGTLFGVEFLFSLILTAILVIVMVPVIIIIVYVTNAISSINIVLLAVIILVSVAFLIFTLWWTSIFEVALAHFYLKLSKIKAPSNEVVDNSIESVNTDESSVVE